MKRGIFGFAVLTILLSLVTVLLLPSLTANSMNGNNPVIERITARILATTPSAYHTQNTDVLVDVEISINAANFAPVKSGSPAKAGEGRLLYTMDVIPPILAGKVVVSPPELSVLSSEFAYTWRNVPAGIHVFCVELLYSDDTPMEHPVLAAAVITVAPQAIPMPTISSSPPVTPFATPSLTPSTALSGTPVISPTPVVTVTPSPSPTATPVTSPTPAPTTPVPSPSPSPSPSTSPLPSPSPSIPPVPTVKIIVYGDFQCTHCEELHRLVEPELISRYVVTGKAILEARPVAFMGAESSLAAQASYCAGDQGKFVEYRDALYNAWHQQGVTAYSLTNLSAIAQQFGLNVDSFNNCLNRGTKRTQVLDNYKLAIAAGVTQVPTIFINSVKLEGVLTLDSFVQAVENELSKS